MQPSNGGYVSCKSKFNFNHMKKHAITIFLLTLFVSAIQAQTKESRDVSTFTKIAFQVPGKLYLRQGSPQKVEIEGDKDIVGKIETKVEGSRLVIEHEDERHWRWGNDDKVNVYITVKNIDALNVGGSGDLIGETKIVTGDIDLNVSGSGNMKVDVEASGDMESDVSGSGNIELRGTCNSFESDVSGSGQVRVTLNASGDADFGVSGSGKIEARGSASKVKANISGSGKVLAADLETNSCEVRITGSGDVEINVKNELDANITGSGSVRYRGNPSKINSHSAGSGSVRKL
jgi:hypothetical protein